MCNCHATPASSKARKWTLRKCFFAIWSDMPRNIIAILCCSVVKDIRLLPGQRGSRKLGLLVSGPPVQLHVNGPWCGDKKREYLPHQKAANQNRDDLNYHSGIHSGGGRYPREFAVSSTGKTAGDGMQAPSIVLCEATWSPIMPRIHCGRPVRPCTNPSRIFRRRSEASRRHTHQPSPACTGGPGSQTTLR